MIGMKGFKTTALCLLYLFVSSYAFAGNWDEMVWDQGVWDITQTLNSEDYVFTTSGDAVWAEQSTVYHDGSTALESGAIGDNEQTNIETTVSDVEMISFYWKVSSETEKDFFRFYIDGVEMASISGEIDWQRITFNLSPGSHTLRWTYSKDSSLVGGDDTAWLDGISTSLFVIAPIIFLLD